MAEPKRRRGGTFSREQIEKSIATRRQRAAERRAQRENAATETVQAPKDIPELEAHARDTLEGAASPENAKKQTQELAETFSQFLVIGTVFAALGLQQPSIAMLDHEAAAIAVPVANLFARTDLNRKFGRYLVGSNDYVALAWSLYQYGKRVMTGWINHAETVQPQRYTQPSGDAGVSSAAGGQPSSPKRGTGTPSANGAGITISPTLLGGGWRGD